MKNVFLLFFLFSFGCGQQKENDQNPFGDDYLALSNSIKQFYIDFYEEIENKLGVNIPITKYQIPMHDNQTEVRSLVEANLIKLGPIISRRLEAIKNIPNLEIKKKSLVLGLEDIVVFEIDTIIIVPDVDISSDIGTKELFDKFYLCIRTNNYYYECLFDLRNSLKTLVIL